MRPDDYLRTARKLLTGHRGRPRQADLEKAVSAAYYAVYHGFNHNNADMLVGTSGSNRSNPAWRQVYRAMDHGYARHQCRDQYVMARLPSQIQSCAETFAALQEKRHQVDYDPAASLSLAEAHYWVDAAAQAIAELAKAPLKDRRAFAVWVTIKRRS